MNDPTPAHGADTLLGVLDEANSQGYSTQQIAHPDGTIQCASCNRHSSPRQHHVTHVRRLEGASDAADLLLVAWSACPNCAERGVLVLGYGPNASAADAAVLTELDLDRADPAPSNRADDAALGVAESITGNSEQ